MKKIIHTLHVHAAPEAVSDALTTEAGLSGWWTTVVTFVFDLSAVDGETRVRFTQEYATEMPIDVYGTYNFNWGYYLNSLKQLCETGSGSPFTVPA